MDWIRIFLSRCRAMGHARRLDAELEEELHAHIDLAMEENLRRGLTGKEARSAALRAFGGFTQTRETYRTQRGFPLLQLFAQDARYALRQWRRAPGFALFTFLVLAMGIGTVTAMFTITYAVLLKPLPFPEDRQLFVPLEKSAKGSETMGAPYSEIKGWQRATQDTADIAFASRALGIVDAPAGAALVTEVEASPNLLSVLRVEPLMGRSFMHEEQEAENPHVALLSYALWRQSFSGDRSVLGKTVHIGAVAYNVIGVMPPEFVYPIDDNRPEVWVPPDRSKLTSSGNDPYATYEPIMRVHAGSSVKAAEAQLEIVHRQLTKQREPVEIQFAGLHDVLVSGVRPALTALEIAVALVWLIACSNVAGLLLARLAVRRTEIAVRSALGAGRRRIFSQLLTESLLLSSAGATGGLALAILMLQFFRRMLQRILPLSQNVHLNWAVWTGLIAVTLLTALAFGTFPAIVAARTGADAALKTAGRRHVGDHGQSRLRSVLLVGQVALSIALLIGAGLMMRTMYALRHAPLGFRTDHVVLTSLTIPSEMYEGRNVASAAWQPLLDAVRQAPGVQSAALTTVMPIGHPVELLTRVYATQGTEGNVGAAVRATTPELMHVLGITMRSGRFFTDVDTAASLPVAVVNQAFVNRYLGGGDAIGKPISFGRIPRTATIVGIMEDIHQDAVAEPSRPELYVPISQLQADDPSYRALLGSLMELAVRTEIPPAVVIPELRREIQQENPHLAIGEFTTMAEAVEDSIGGQRLAAGVIGVFGGLALLITIFGLYGLLSYLVAQRTQEIGIRMALGADRSRVVGMFMRQTLVLTGAGTIFGVGLAFWSARLLRGFLFGVSSSDPWTMVLVPLALVVCGLLATIFPARRAATINPVQALRTE
jgi:predicted permease